MGPDTLTLPPYSLSSVAMALTCASNESVGCLVMILIRPADADLPYSVLCGPRRTSMRSTSGRSLNARAWKGSGTSKFCRSEEHTSELQSQFHLVCRLLLEKKKTQQQDTTVHKKNTRRLQS